MVDLHASSDSEDIESDEELQQAFASGKLKPGLNVEVQAPKQHINNVSGMKQKLEELEQGLSWIERLDLTNPPAPPPPGAAMETEDDGADIANNDFKRELRFYRQAQASVLVAIPKLHKLGIKTRRPEDFFAEMGKTDAHMKKVREKLLEKQQNIENRDKARKLRELRKYGKKNKLDFLEDKKGSGKGSKTQNRTEKPHQPNKRRQHKDTKYGFGGQKKRSKMNTKETSADMSGFSRKVHQSKPGKQFTNKNKNKGNRNKRPGKDQRHKMKNKKK
ncbi:EBP2-like protein [Mya arenaria]|uniref:EBP2-like protein n=1 Tax=Mya arenaria TaxID=6604 RepID=A0ABY7FPQ1_MYAAR|nr:EBP2-like protein [Mya arenaria]